MLSKKPAAFSGITNSSYGTAIAQENLIPLLSLLNMRLMNYPRLAIPHMLEQTDEDGKLKLTVSEPFLEKQARAFIRFIEKSK